MACTTILIGKKATNDGSTIIARTDDGRFDVKRVTIVPPSRQPKTYKSKITGETIELPDDPLRYSACPNVIGDEGIWAATGINEANVGMTATETITSNPRVLAADPLVKVKNKAAGFGEEDFLVLVLPYIRSAREGVLRLAEILEKHGTYESNGVAFNDENEIWWMETIGGHHYVAARVPDDMAVIAPNQFAMDHFDFEDALGPGKNFLCSKDLPEFIRENRLDLNNEGPATLRNVFGSLTDADHVYNTPRAWYMGRFLAPYAYKWDGPDRDFGPESDNIPFALKPWRKVSVEDVKYILGSHFQGTEFDPYIEKNRSAGTGGMYRPIGVNRTDVMGICQIRGYAPDLIKGVFWFCFGTAAYSAMMPVYTGVAKLPAYIENVSRLPSTNDLHWASRMIGALADSCRGSSLITIERYHNAVTTEARRLLIKYDREYAEKGDPAVLMNANKEIAAMVREKTDAALGSVLRSAMENMKNGYRRPDN